MAIRITFYDRKGNQLVQIPSSYLKNATSKTNKLIIPYHNETWIIEKNKNDNLKEVEKMLSYLKTTHFVMNAKICTNKLSVLTSKKRS